MPRRLNKDIRIQQRVLFILAQNLVIEAYQILYISLSDHSADCRKTIIYVRPIQQKSASAFAQKSLLYFDCIKQQIKPLWPPLVPANIDKDSAAFPKFFFFERRHRNAVRPAKLLFPKMCRILFIFGQTLQSGCMLNKIVKKQYVCDDFF